MPRPAILEEIRGQGRTLVWLARELQMEPSLFRKRLIGQRPPFTEAQAKYLRALLDQRIPLDQIPYVPDKREAVA